jgi:hypothetical protein
MVGIRSLISTLYATGLKRAEGGGGGKPRAMAVKAEMIGVS